MTNEYLALARIEAQKGNCLKRNYGCVIVDPIGRVVSKGYTFTRAFCKKCKRRFARKGHGYDKCTSIHAEQACVSGTEIPFGSVAFLVCFDADKNEIRNPRPCPTCERLLKWAGVYEVITATEVIRL